MKKKDKRILAALAAGAICLCGAAAAAGGSASDPLVTLSYLNQTVTPNVLSQVDTKVDAKAAELERSLNQAIAGYTSQMEQALGGAGGGGSVGTANYAVVTLSGGQRLDLALGAEVMLRVGSASCVADSNPGLVDSTSGGTLNNGGALTVNHLYLATIENRAVTAGSGTVKLLVRGGYTVR